jgi:hypothetical protein
MFKNDEKFLLVESGFVVSSGPESWGRSFRRPASSEKKYGVVPEALMHREVRPGSGFC